MKRKLWIAFLVIVLAVSLAMIVYSAAAAKGFDGPIGKPLICKAASVYSDGTVIERPCQPNMTDGASGLRMTLPTPGKFYRPEGWLP